MNKADLIEQIAQAAEISKSAAHLRGGARAGDPHGRPVELDVAAAQLVGSAQEEEVGRVDGDVEDGDPLRLCQLDVELVVDARLAVVTGAHGEIDIAVQVRPR